MSKYLISMAIICLSISISAYRFLPTPNSLAFAKDTLMNPLVLYGQYIYQREKCATCHTTPEHKKALFHQISLDGLGRKYPNSWHYYHLLEPSSISPYSKMPAFPDLFKKEINEATLYKLIGKARKKGGAYPVDYEKTAYAELCMKSTEIKADLAKDKIRDEGIEKKELVALLTYLQQIPTSSAKRLQDSTRLANETQEWNRMMNNEENSIMKLALSTNKDTIALGKEIFMAKCAVCHGQSAEGAIGPNLTDEYWLHGAKAEDIVKTIMEGFIEKGMLGWKSELSPYQIGELTAYIRSLKGTNPENAKEPQGEKE